MKPITLKQLNKRIEENNESFHKMTKAQKRVTIAQDCLDRINIKQITPKQGVFVKPVKKYSDRNREEFYIPIKDTLHNEPKRVCQACAKGAIFMSYIGQVNSYDFGDLTASSSDAVDCLISEEMGILEEIFDTEQLDLIEVAFEEVAFHWTTSNYKNNKKAIEFSKQYKSMTTKLIAICKNIIENKGTFKP